MDLIRRLRYYGYFDHIGITEREPGEVFEKLIDHLASSVSTASGSDRARVSTASGSDRPRVSTASGSDRPRVSTASGSDRPGVKQQAKKSSKPRKERALPPESDEIISEPVKLHYIIDRRDFLEKVKSVYASYAA